MVPLRYVSAQNMFKLLDGFGVKAPPLRPDNGRNTLIITGSGSDRAAAIDTILSFDADWMRGQSVGIFPVRNSTPEPLISELEKIMDSGEGGLSQNVVKFQAITRLNSILVVSQKPEYLKRAALWISRLDRSDMEAANLKSYPLRYGNAKLVVALLNEMLVGLGRCRHQPRQRHPARSRRAPAFRCPLRAPSRGAAERAADRRRRRGDAGHRRRRLSHQRAARTAPRGAGSGAAPFAGSAHQVRQRLQLPARTSASPPTSPIMRSWSMPMPNRNASSSRPSARSTGRSARSRSRRRSPR